MRERERERRKIKEYIRKMGIIAGINERSN